MLLLLHIASSEIYSCTNEVERFSILTKTTYQFVPNCIINTNFFVISGINNNCQIDGSKKLLLYFNIEGVYNISITSDIFNKTLILNLKETKKNFRLVSLSDIKYSDQFKENWYITDNSEWPVKSGTYPDRNSVTRYYLTSFTFTGNLDLTSYIKVKFKCDAGVVVYLNGKIVYRRGLGKIFVNDEFSKTEYPTDEIKELWITHAALKIGENILGFEIHKHLNSLARDSFDILSVDFVSDEIDLCTVTNKYEPTMFIHSTRGYEYDRSNDTFTTKGHVANNLNKLSSINMQDWLDGYCVLNKYQNDYNMPQGNHGQPSPEEPLNITMRYPENIAKTFTQYYLVVNFNNQYDFAPWIWTFHGSYDNSTETNGDWDLLQTIPEAGFPTPNASKKTFQLFNQYQSYDYFRIMITRKRGQGGMDQTFLHRLHVQYCKPRYCEADGEFPKSKAGFIASIPCPFGHIGSKDRNCKLNDGEVPFWEVAVDNNCKQVPTFLNYEDLTFYKGYNEVFIPTYDEGITPLNFETNCTFPNGISLNSNGQISGTSSADIDGGSFVLEMKCRITLVHQLQNYSEVVDFTYKSKTFI